MKTPTKKQKNMQKKKKKRPRRKKLSLEEKDRMERRTITITGLVSDITTESIRSTFKCWNKTVKRLKRDNASTIKVTFATHRDFRDSMSMLKILAYSTSSGSNTQTEAASSRTLSNAGSHEIAEYRKHGYGIPLRMMLPAGHGAGPTGGWLMEHSKGLTYWWMAQWLSLERRCSMLATQRRSRMISCTV